MKFFSLFVPAVAAALVAADTLQYDPVYDMGSESMAVVACSDGSNGLLNRFPTFNSLPTFPNIGAFGAIEGFNSAQCGTCWQIVYTDSNGVSSAPLIVTAIDHAGAGLINVSEEAMNTLTNGNAVAFGAVQVTATQVSKSLCGTQ